MPQLPGSVPPPSFGGPDPQVPKPPASGLHIFAINLGIYLAYVVVGAAMEKQGVFNGIFLIAFGYIIHALVLIISGITRGVTKKPNAWAFAVTGILLLVIGFGGCTYYFTRPGTRLI